MNPKFTDTSVPDVDIGLLPVVREESVVWLWTQDYFDGPLTGVLTWEGRSCWFVFRDEDDQSRFSYVLFALTEDEFASLAAQRECGEFAYPPASVREHPVAVFVDVTGQWRDGRDPRYRSVKRWESWDS